MKNNYMGVIILLVLLSGNLLGLHAQDLSQVQLTSTPGYSPQQKSYHDDKIYVKFRNLETGTALEFKDKKERNLKLKQDKISKALLKADARLMKQAAGKGSGQEVARIFQVELDGSASSVKQLLDELKAMPEVEYAERVPIYYTHAAPNDPQYVANNQYSLNITKAIQAYTSFNKSSSAPVKVAIIDDAVLISHNDLKANIWTNPGETGLDANGNNKATNGIDDDGNGYIDDVNGWDAADKDNNPNPPLVPTANGNLASSTVFSHGTHCAGIAGAVTGNGIGVASVSNNKVQIVPVKSTYDNVANTNSINTSFDGLVYALFGAKAQVVSMSFGGGGYSLAMQDLINEGAAMGVVFIASAGNNANDIEQYPANYEHVISVANTDAMDWKSSSSTFGKWVTISAPGSSILSTVPGTGAGIATGGYAYKSGTSMSGPMVAGLVGFLKSQNPALTPAQVKQILTSTADNVDLMNRGYEGLLGAGRINAYNAILAAGGTVLAPTVDFMVNKLTFIVGEDITFVNRSTGSNLSYAWTFQNASKATSSETNPTVSFTTPGTHTVALTVNGTATKTMQVTVTGFAAEDILGLPLAGAVGASGVNGHSGNNIPAFANFYKYATSHHIAGVNISFRIATAGTPTSTIRVKVWETERGVPGRVLHTQTVKISDLVANGLVGTMSPNYIYFDKPVQVPADKNFFIGFEIDYGKGDNISIHHYTSPLRGLDAALYFNNRWQLNGQVGAAWTFAIFPILAEQSSFPSGTIAVSATEACIGNTVNFNAAGVKNADSHLWNLGNNMISTDVTTSATYDAAGTYLPVLTATRAVTITKGTTDYPVQLRNSFTKQIRVADCSKTPVAAFDASALSANVGSSIQFLNKTQHATSYEWLIVQGANRFTSTEANPVINFTTRGKYDVTLTTRNPEGKASESYKKQYIEIFTAGQDCGNLNFPFASRLTAYGAAAGGALSGHNGYGIKDYAKVFDVTPGSVLTKAMLNIFLAVATAPAQSYATIKVWDASGPDGMPGQVLSSTQVSYTRLMQATANGGNIEVILDQPVIIPANGKVYIGFSVEYTGKETLYVSTNVAGPGLGERSFFLFGGQWMSLKDGVGLATEYAIGGATFENIDKLPIADFTVSATSVAVGEAIKLDASKSKKGQIYNWNVSGGTLSAMGEGARAAVYDPTKAAVSFSQVGTYTITLEVLGDCNAKVATKTVQVEVTGGAIASQSSTAASMAEGKDALEDKSIVYPNPSSGSFNLVVNGAVLEQLTISVWDLKGRQVLRKDITLGSSSEVQQLNLTDQPAGLYLIRVSNGNKVQTHKLMKE